MSDHAIVLYDPTIDDKPSPEEAEAARLEVEEKKKKAEEEKLRGGSVHKSLKEILGIVSEKDKVKKDVRVPVVIDPRLTKVLRPHQIEGVKVRDESFSSIRDLRLFDSVFLAVLVSVHDWYDRSTCFRMYHGGRNGFG